MNIAKDKKVIVDSVHMSYVGSNAVNGDISTNNGRWVSANTKGHFIEIDFGAKYTIDSIKLYFGWNGYNNPTKQYRLKYFNGTDWVTCLEIVDNISATPTHVFPAVTTDKVRWETDAAGHVRMYEIEIFSDWKLTWQDDFKGTALDTTKWSYHKSSYSNNEQSYYSEGNVVVNDGLTIVAEEKSNIHNKPFVSGAIQSKFSQTYGRFEMRAKLPVGQGFWPAFWLLPTDNAYGPWPMSGEIDVMETGGDTNRYVGTIHYAGLNNQHQASSTGSVQLPNGGRNEDYHVYAIEWEPKEMRWYCDDVLMGRTSTWRTFGPDGQMRKLLPAPFNKPFYIIVNLAVGGSFVGGKLPLSSGEMVVDYIRAFAKDSYEMPVDKPDEPILLLRDPNMLAGGSWVLDGKYAISIAGLTVSILNDVNEQHLQSIRYSTNLSFVRGRRYKLSFKARSSVPCKHVRPAIDRPNAGWGKILLYNSLEFGTEMQDYVIEFTAAVTDNSARLLFYMGLMTGDIGGGAHTIQFQDVRLEEAFIGMLDEWFASTVLDEGAAEKFNIIRRLI